MATPKEIDIELETRKFRADLEAMRDGTSKAGRALFDPGVMSKGAREGALGAIDDILGPQHPASRGQVDFPQPGLGSAPVKFATPSNIQSSQDPQNIGTGTAAPVSNREFHFQQAQTGQLPPRPPGEPQRPFDMLNSGINVGPPPVEELPELRRFLKRLKGTLRDPNLLPEQRERIRAAIAKTEDRIAFNQEQTMASAFQFTKVDLSDPAATEASLKRAETAGAPETLTPEGAVPSALAGDPSITALEEPAGGAVTPAAGRGVQKPPGPDMLAGAPVLPKREGAFGQGVTQVPEEDESAGPDVPTPDLTEDDDLDSAIQRLNEFLDTDQPTFEPRPLTGGQRFAAGLMAALNPARYRAEIVPALERRQRDALNRGTAERQWRGQQLSVLTALANLESAALDRKEKRRVEDMNLMGIASALQVTRDSLLITQTTAGSAIKGLRAGGFDDEADALMTRIAGISGVITNQAALAQQGVLPNIQAVQALQKLDREVNLAIARAFRRSGKGAGGPKELKATELRLVFIEGGLRDAMRLIFPQGRSGPANKIGGFIAGSALGSILQNLSPKNKRELELLRGAFSKISGAINRLIGGGAALTPNEEARFAGILLNVNDNFTTQLAKMETLQNTIDDVRERVGSPGQGAGRDVPPPAGATDVDQWVIGEDPQLISPGRGL